MPFNPNSPTHKDAFNLFENWMSLGKRIDRAAAFQEYASDLRYEDGFSDADDPALDRMLEMAEQEEDELTRVQKALQEEALERFGLTELNLLEIRAGGCCRPHSEVLAGILDRGPDGNN